MSYRVDPTEYLDRVRRMQAARGVTSGHLNTDDIRRILAEVPPLELLPGQRYRIRLLGGKPISRHTHFIHEQSGREIILDAPDVAEPEWLEVELTFERRGGRDEGLLANNLLFLMPDGQRAALADMDILSLDLVA